MADATGKKLLQLLDNGRPAEVRRAAALVLGELGMRDGGIGETLREALDDADPVFRMASMASIGKLRVDGALPQLLEKVRAGGEEAAVAAQAAAQLGAKGTHALQNLMSQVAPGLRRRIASALAGGGTPSAETAAIDVLLDTDPNVVDAAASSLCARIPNLEPAHRRTLADEAVKLLAPRKNQRLSPRSETALLRVLSAIGDKRGESIFWTRIEPSHPPEVRAGALAALGTLPTTTARDKIKRLFVCAGDSDFRIVAPALMILKGLPLSDKSLPDWLPLFDAADPAARRFAIEKLGHKDTAAVAAKLLGQLDHPDRTLRDRALASLGQLAAGRDVLARAILDAESPDRAWALAKASLPFAKQYSAEQRKRIFARTSDFLEEADRRADALLYLLREMDAKWLAERLEERALALRKKKRYPAALIFLRLLARDPSCGDPIRFELAACGLKVSEHAIDAESRAADPCLEQFAGLLHRHEVEPSRLVEKAKWLAPEDLFYLGFHFVERSKEERDFGADMLRLLIRRSPKTKLGKDAKNKLRSQGLD